jgi:hypothetical protein
MVASSQKGERLGLSKNRSIGSFTIRITCPIMMNRKHSSEAQRNLDEDGPQRTRGINCTWRGRLLVCRPRRQWRGCAVAMCLFQSPQDSNATRNKQHILWDGPASRLADVSMSQPSNRALSTAEIDGVAFTASMRLSLKRLPNQRP